MNTSAVDKQKILVIDDDFLIRRIVRKALEENGYKVFLAVNGNDGLKIAHSASPDLILLDILLPDMNGFQVCTRLRSLKSTSEIPIIMMTAVDQPSDVVRGFDVGTDDYVAKPFAIEELMARIKARLRRRGVSSP